MGTKTSQLIQNKDEDEPILIENENEIKQNEILTNDKKEEIEIETEKENENEILTNDKKEEIFETKGLFYPSKAVDETVIKLQIPKTMKEQLNKSEFILILDISGSMGNYANDIIRKVMPKVFDLLKYPENKKFYFIGFESYVHYYEMTKNDFLNSGIGAL
jgi:hypothetical protein